MRYFKTIKMLPLLCASVVVSGSVMAEDWAISAAASCETELGTTVASGGGIKASGGTAVVSCPFVKEVVGNAMLNVYARMKRASTNGASSFCYLISTAPYGSPSDSSYGYPSNTTATQSVSVPLPDQYYSGYQDLYCVLVNNDILYGVRYKQKN